MLKNAANPFGVLRSKGIHTFFVSNFKKIYMMKIILATGEPPLCMSVSVLFALRNAVCAARSDSGISDWYQMGKSYILITN